MRGVAGGLILTFKYRLDTMCLLGSTAVIDEHRKEEV